MRPITNDKCVKYTCSAGLIFIKAMINVLFVMAACLLNTKTNVLPADNAKIVNTLGTRLTLCTEISCSRGEPNAGPLNSLLGKFNGNNIEKRQNGVVTTTMTV